MFELERKQVMVRVYEAPDSTVAHGSELAADAFTTEVIRGAIISITDEMKTTLMRTAYSRIVYEMEDFTVGIYDRDGNTLSLGLGLPMWMSGMGEAVKMKITHWGKDNLHPGDVLLTSAVAVHGSHVNHMIFTVPVFHEGELVAFSSSMAHWPDVGGVLAGTTQDIWSEGFQLPFVKIYREGVPDQQIFDIIRINVRYPEIAAGDTRAQLATIRTGERRLVSLLEKYGNAAFQSAIQHIYEQSERLARQAVREIPDGVYEAEQFIDSDGIDLDRTIPVKVRVIVSGDEMTVDLSDMAPRVRGYVNCGATAGRSGAQVGFKTLTTPTLLPVNDGALRNLRIILPDDTIISARHDAAVRWWMVVPDTIVDTIWKALTPVIPARGTAGHHGVLGGAAFYGWVDDDGHVIPGRGNNPGFLSGGGWGAVLGADGQCATVCINDGDTHAAPVESGEAKAPDLVMEKSLWQDSGGAGRWRGGLGVVQRIEARIPSMFQHHVERSLCPPFGVAGGKDGKANAVEVWRKDSVERPRLAVVSPTRIEPGESAVSYMGGGGGFGDPLERPAEQVLEDVRDEYVSLEAAREDYGVVINHPAPRSYALDVEATDQLRAQMSGEASGR